jgi:acylglycerol lipase
MLWVWQLPFDWSWDCEHYYIVWHFEGDHCSRYSHVFEEFAKEGFQVDSFDQRGFGHSGKSSHANLEFDGIVQDLAFVYGKAAANLPRFLYGVDVGAVAIAQFVIQHPEDVGKKDSPNHVDGIILASPLLRPRIAKSSFKKSTLKLRGMVTPSTNTPILKDTQYLSRDPAVVASYQEDK